MGVDDAKRLVLLSEIVEQARQHDMLDDVGEISGVVGVAVVHDPLPLRMSLPQNRCTLLGDMRQPLPQRGGGGCEFGFSGLPPPPERKDSRKPIKPIAISEK